jgi:hypothetical protein
VEQTFLKRPGKALTAKNGIPTLTQSIVIQCRECNHKATLWPRSISANPRETKYLPPPNKQAND